MTDYSPLELSLPERTGQETVEQRLAALEQPDAAQSAAAKESAQEAAQPAAAQEAAQADAPDAAAQGGDPDGV